MPGNILYAYVDGSDLEEFASRVCEELEAFVGSKSWMRETWVVDERYPPDANDGPNDLPLWELGLNHVLPDSAEMVGDWFEDIGAIGMFLHELATRFGREFAVGVGLGAVGQSEDVYFISAEVFDFELMLEMVEHHVRG